MKVRIYQMNKELDTENALFMGFDFAEKHGGVDPSTYMCVFDGSLGFSDIEEVYALCNTEHPIGYNGHSLSVSDIVETDDGSISATQSASRSSQNLIRAKLSL